MYTRKLLCLGATCDTEIEHVVQVESRTVKSYSWTCTKVHVQLYDFTANLFSSQVAQLHRLQQISTSDVTYTITCLYTD